MHKLLRTIGMAPLAGCMLAHRLELESLSIRCLVMGCFIVSVVWYGLSVGSQLVKNCRRDDCFPS